MADDFKDRLTEQGGYMRTGPRPTIEPTLSQRGELADRRVMARGFALIAAAGAVHSKPSVHWEDSWDPILHRADVLADWILR